MNTRTIIFKLFEQLFFLEFLVHKDFKFYLQVESFLKSINHRTGHHPFTAKRQSPGTKSAGWRLMPSLRLI